MKTVITRQIAGFLEAMKGIPWHVFPTDFFSCPSGLSPGTRAWPKTQDAQLHDLMNLRL